VTLCCDETSFFVDLHHVRCLYLRPRPAIFVAFLITDFCGFHCMNGTPGGECRRAELRRSACRREGPPVSAETPSGGVRPRRQSRRRPPTRGAPRPRGRRTRGIHGGKPPAAAGAHRCGRAGWTKLVQVRGPAAAWSSTSRSTPRESSSGANCDRGAVAVLGLFDLCVVCCFPLRTVFRFCWL